MESFSLRTIVFEELQLTINKSIPLCADYQDFSYKQFFELDQQRLLKLYIQFMLEEKLQRWNNFQRPITEVVIGLALLKDAILHPDLDQGVWIGKRLISGSVVGISSYLTEVINSNILHYAFMVDGKAYHLAGQKGKSLGSGTKVKMLVLNEDKSQFEWFYKGKLKCTLKEIQSLINWANEANIEYDFLEKAVLSLPKPFPVMQEDYGVKQMYVKLLHLIFTRVAQYSSSKISHLLRNKLIKIVMMLTYFDGIFSIILYYTHILFFIMVKDYGLRIIF